MIPHFAKTRLGCSFVLVLVLRSICSVILNQIQYQRNVSKNNQQYNYFDIFSHTGSYIFDLSYLMKLAIVVKQFVHLCIHKLNLFSYFTPKLIVQLELFIACLYSCCMVTNIIFIDTCAVAVCPAAVV